ncbi:hypothetical protein L905_06330 [Agrobacterium sp. TS43]|nr:hypothetical protein L905_06330 [Agrobacterium sp. TS43]
MQHGAQVHVDQEINVTLIRFQKLLRAVDAGIVHEDIERNLTGELCKRRPVRHIDGMGETACALRQLVESVRASGNRMHFQPFAAKALNDGGANSGRCAGYECSLVV